MGKSRNYDKKKEKSALQQTTTKKEERKLKKEFKKQKHRQKNYDTHEESSFRGILHLLGLRVKYVDADGNCMFRSLCDQITGIVDDHVSVRSQIIDYIVAHSEHFSLFIEDDEPFNDYVGRMRDVGEWGGHQELYAAAQCLEVNIVVHQVDAPRFIILCESGGTRDIHISYHGEVHYNSVRLISDDDEGPADPINLNGSLNDQGQSLRKTLTHPLLHIVQKALPWASEDDILMSLKLSNDDVDEAIERIMTDPDGFKDQRAMFADTLSESTDYTSTIDVAASTHQGVIVFSDSSLTCTGSGNVNPRDDIINFHMTKIYRDGNDTSANATTTTTAESSFSPILISLPSEPIATEGNCGIESQQSTCCGNSTSVIQSVKSSNTSSRVGSKKSKEAKVTKTKAKNAPFADSNSSVLNGKVLSKKVLCSACVSFVDQVRISL